MKRKHVTVAVLVAGALLAAILLARKNGQTEPATIRVIGEAVSTVEAIEKLAGEFTKQTGIRVEVEKYEFETALQKATLDLTSRTGTYDVILQYAVALGKFAQQGHLVPVDELRRGVPKEAFGDFDPTRDLFSEVWQELSWFDGVCYGYPFAANTMYMWYRKDLIENPEEKKAFRAKYGYDLGVPTTWKEYRDVAEFFTRPSQGLHGTAIQGKRHPALWYEWLNFAFSFGGGVMDKMHGGEYGPIIINSPETIQATEYYHDLLRFSPPGTTNFTWDDALSEMQQGRIAMCIMWSDAVFGLEDPKASKVVGKMGYAPPPAGPKGSMAQIAGGSYFVSKYSKHPSEAFRFVLWCMQRDNQIKQQLSGGASPVKSVYDEVQVKAIPYTQAHVESLSRARYMTDSIAETDQIRDIIQIALSDVLSGTKSPKEALDRAAVEINRLLPDKCPLKYQPQ